MRKSMHRALSLLLALVMVFGLLPQSFTFASAQDDSEKFACESLTASADKEPMPEGPIEEAPFFSVIGEVTKRWKADKGVTSVEVKKACGSAIAFTLNGTAKVEVVMSSTGGSNTSAVGVINAEGELMSNAEEILTITGTSRITMTYNLEAGTYRVVSPADEANDRGARVYAIEVTMLEAASETEEHNFDAATLTAAADKEAVAEGMLTEDGYFSVSGTVQKRTDKNTGAVKSVELGKNESGDISFTVTGTATMKMAVSSTGSSNTSAVALLDADGNVVANAEEITQVSGTAKIELSYTLEAGKYRIVSPQSDLGRGVRVYSVEVSETVGAVAERTAWEDVAAPVITSVVQNGGNLDVSVEMVIGYHGADAITVSMLDEQGNTLMSKTSTEEGRVISFTPVASGSYRFTVVAKRGSESEKLGYTEETTSFVLPLSVPVINLIHQGANGALTVIWSASREATAYEIGYTAADGSAVSEIVEARQYTFEGLTVGESYDFSVVALRGEERSAASETVAATAAAEASTAWSFSRYGDSTDDAHNGYILNEDGSVTVYSEGGKGKIQPASTDGLAFYYTAVPTDENFTLRVNVHVDSWTFSNGQDGFGILATDRLGSNGSATSFWTNQYMLGLSKIEYRWDADSEIVYDINSAEGMKFSMKLGLGAYAKTGLTAEALDYMGTSPVGFQSVSLPMEFTATEKAIEAGTYNIVGNATASVEGTLVELTDFVLEIQKNNTGYFLSYYDQEGNLIHREKNYDPDALNKLDSEFVYVGFFASRNARATFTVQEFSTIKASEDAPAEEKPVTTITPEVTISSANVAQSENYTLTFMTNVDGTASIRINDKITDMKDIPVKANELVSIPVSVAADDVTSIAVYFKPDPEQDLGEDTVLSGTGTISSSVDVTHTSAFAERTNLYVAPDGFSTGDGSRRKPLDIYTAVSVARPGQTIILTEGTYLLEQTVKIQRGVDGTQEAFIRMIADPEAATRPVLDFQGLCAGIVHGGNYWLFSGFDVTNSKDKEKGFQVSGSNNILQDIVAHHNGNTGIQISRLSGKTDLTIESWPADNLILNCTSYANADSGCEDADGFAAKLTCGEGNVFDGCVAYNNADDGWDLFAKVETGPIGSVTIRNCVAYNNGYLEDGSKAGNGNGFKMGGASITGKHQLINSVAFNNKAKGIDSNSCPDIIVENCISYNNGSYNVAFYTNVEQDTAFKASGLISFKDSNCDSVATGENLKPRGTQNEKDYRNDSCYYWDGTACINASGVVLAADIFVSTEFKGVVRNADGTLDLQGFLELTENAPADAGARLKGNGTALYDVPVTDSEALISDDEKAAMAVSKLIDELGTITLNSKDKIAAARAAYDALSDAQKAFVDNYEILQAAEARLAELEAAQNPTEPDPTEPDPTEPDPTEPDPTEPDPTEPDPTEPEHNWNEGTVTTEPTCATEGVKTFRCTLCDATMTETIPATGMHAWVVNMVITAPTCGSMGVNELECSVCGETTRDETVPATGDHAWDEGRITTAPTAETEGVKTFTCTVCAATKTEPVQLSETDPTEPDPTESNPTEPEPTAIASEPKDGNNTVVIVIVIVFVVAAAAVVIVLMKKKR